MCGLQERVEPNKKNRLESSRNRPGSNGARELHPRGARRAACDRINRRERLRCCGARRGSAPGPGFRRGFSDASRSLPPWPGAVHAPRPIPPRPWGAWSRPTPSARGSKRGCQNPFIIHRNMGPLASSIDVRRKGLVQVQITGKRIDGGNQDRIQLVSQAA